MDGELRRVTIIYYTDESLRLKHDIKCYPKNKNGRVIIPDGYKLNKSIIAVCNGEVNVLNKIGERVAIDNVAHL